MAVLLGSSSLMYRVEVHLVAGPSAFRMSDGLLVISVEFETLFEGFLGRETRDKRLLDVVVAEVFEDEDAAIGTFLEEAAVDGDGSAALTFGHGAEVGVHDDAEFVFLH